MKKIILSIVAVLYFCASTGATVHMHYCMDKLVSWGLNDDGNKCKNCGMEKDGGCCKDEKQFLKNSTDQQFSGQTAIDLPLFKDIIGTVDLIIAFEHCHSPLIEGYPTSHAPPLDNGRDILIHNSVFRI